MPYKRGPNGTLRYYSSSTGKYTSAPESQTSKENNKRKINNEEKLIRKKEMLYNHVIKSQDKYVQDLFMFLEKNDPGTVILVNERVYHKKIKGTREIDIMTKNSIIEVKSGKVRHKTKQFLEQKDLANDHKKQHIVYAPDITDKKYLELKSKGINVVRTKDELLERNKKWKI